MSVIEKMSILGIRSFGADDQNKQLIEFFKPLTLILGPNGTGKTTIIECLRYVTTGDMPPNSERGGSFVHDPKIAGETEVKGQVKLQLKDVLDKRLIVSRNLAVSQKQKKIQFKTLEGTITRYGSNGEKSSLSSKCAEIDKEMITALGVSKPILNNVIFCHQEESNWPLSEGKALKQKFDEIFAATRYIKALEEIKKIRAQKMIDIREYKINAVNQKENKRKASELAANLESTEARFAACKDSVEEIADRIQPIQDNLKEIDTKERKFMNFKSNFDSKTTLLDKLKKDQTSLKNSIKELFTGSKLELKREIENFNDTLRQKERQLDKVNKEIRETDSEITKMSKSHSKLLEESGKLKTEHKQHEQRIATRDRKLEELSKQLGLGDISTSIEECLRDSQVQNVIRNWKQKIIASKQEFDNAKAKHETNEHEVQNELDKVRDTISKKDQLRKSSTEKINKNKKEIHAIEEELGHADSLAARQEDLMEDLNEAKEELETLEKSVDIDALRAKIATNQKKKRELESQVKNLSREMEQLQTENKTRTEIDLTSKDKKSKTEAVEKIFQRHKDVVTHLIGEMPKNNTQECMKKFANSLNQDVQQMSKELNKKKGKLSSLETTKKFHDKELESKESLLTSHKQKIVKVCGNHNFDEGFDVLEKTVKELQDEKGALNGSLYWFNSYIEKMDVPKPCCPLCRRSFEHVDEAKSLIEELQNKLQSVPNQTKDKEASILNHQMKLNKMLELRPLKKEIINLSEKEIPDMITKIKEVEESIETNKNEITELEEALEMKQCDLKAATNMLPDLAMLDQAQRELDRLERRLSTLSCQLRSGDISRTLTQVTQELKEKQSALESIRSNIEQNQSQISEHIDKVQGLKGRINDLNAEKMAIADRLQKKNALEEKLSTLTAEITELNDTLREITLQQGALDKRIKALVNQKKELIKTKEQDLEKIRKKIRSEENEMVSIDSLVFDIERYVKDGKEARLATHETKIATSKSTIDRNNEEKKTLSQLEKDLSKELTSQQVKQRELQDNMKYLETNEEITELSESRQTLETQMGNFNIRNVLLRKKQLSEQADQLNKEKSKQEGRQTELKNQVNHLKKELQDNIYKDADKKYREIMIKLKTTDLVCDDLNKYYIALDRAIMQYHRLKMDEINKIVRDLWIDTYAGNDIDYIEIRSNEDESESGLQKARRVYDYKVVMVKGDTAIDMRGRCSAGQKVLASLIIRLALAETFCLNCGILALDEPTTNLDRDNISRLGQALAKIVEARSEQRNFQLIVITHDEDFISLLGSYNQNEYFYKVSKDANSCSRLTKCSISLMP